MRHYKGKYTRSAFHRLVTLSRNEFGSFLKSQGVLKILVMIMSHAKDNLSKVGNVDQICVFSHLEFFLHL